MKIFVQNFNNILDEVIVALKQKDWYTDNIQQADALLLWQDVRGDCKRVAGLFKEFLKKPVFVMQHGRGATRDYDKPNSFSLLGDLFLAWGPAEKRRMDRLGLGDRTVVVGSPLCTRLHPKEPHPGFRVLFAPVISQKEEPENIIVYSKLKEIECQALTRRMQTDFEFFKKGWGTKNITTNCSPEDNKLIQRGLKKPTDYPHTITITPTLPDEAVYSEMMLQCVLAGVHDVNKYMSPKVVVPQGKPNSIDIIIAALCNTDVLVCLEEGTMPLLATALNVPVIHVDIHKYRSYGGVDDYDRVEKIKTNATYYTDKLNDLPGLLEYCRLKNKDNKFKEQLRIKVVEDELGPQYGNPIKNILDAIEQYMGAYAKV